MKSLLIFTASTLLGIYLAQTYNIPNIKQLFEYGSKQLKDWEKSNKK